MRYTIRWTEQAENDLMLWWVSASDRKAINRAEELSNRYLADNPFVSGVELLEGLFILDIHPLRFYFEVDPIERIVVVTSVASFAH